MFERVQEQQRKIEQQHLLAGLPRSRHSLVQHIIRRLRPSFVALNKRMQRIEQSSEYPLTDL